MKKVYLLLAMLLAAGILAACNEDNDDQAKENEEQRPTPVHTAEAEKGDLVVNRTVTGRMSPSSTTPVMLSQPGEIDTLEVENGDTVDEDDRLATLVSRAGEQAIKAPKDGTILNLDAKEGDMVSGEEPLALVADLNKMTGEFAVPSKVLDLFKKDETYDLTSQGETYEADLTDKSLMPNDQGLYTVKATVKNDDQALLPGMVVKLMVPEKRVKDSVLIPTSALIEESDGTYVFIVSDGQVSKTEIETEEIQSDQTAVKSGVKAGDEIVVTGQTSLADGSKVEVVKEGESS